MQGKQPRASKSRAFTPEYVSPKQLTIEGFETPFEQKLLQNNRWVKLAHSIPWDSIVIPYNNLFRSREGRPPINGRVILGAIIIKHMGDFTDRETVAQIAENPYMQYFLGYTSFTQQAPFSHTLFVEIRERLSLELLERINAVITLNHIKEGLSDGKNSSDATDRSKEANPKDDGDGLKDGRARSTSSNRQETATAGEAIEGKVENNGKLLVDATVAPQDITFPTDLKLLNAATRKSEQIIDLLYCADLHGEVKPRTYRRVARKNFLNTAKKKRKTAKELYKANGQQLRYLRRNLKTIEKLLSAYRKWPLKYRDLKYVMVLNTVYLQQDSMYRNRTHSVEDRIVSIHQPHVRPIVRGKERVKTEFGSKIHVSLVSGFTFIDHLSWDNFNEGGYLLFSVEQYKKRFGFYPAVVHADRIYCTRENRRLMKERKVKLVAKPLGRPSAQAVKNHVSPGARNPIEGKFGQGKRKYGWDNIRAKLQTTSESWVASIALVLNLVRLAGQAPLRVVFSNSCMITIAEYYADRSIRFRVRACTLLLSY